jgi:hypothetical protein
LLSISELVRIQQIDSTFSTSYYILWRLQIFLPKKNGFIHRFFIARNTNTDSLFIALPIGGKFNDKSNLTACEPNRTAVVDCEGDDQKKGVIHKDHPCPKELYITVCPPAH